MKEFGRFPVRDFLDELGSESPAPGGGAAAAMTAALGAGLLEMASRLNAKRIEKKSGSPDPGAPARIGEAEKIRHRLLELASLDAAAFEEIARRSAESREGAPYREALKNGASVPLEICGLAARALELCADERPRTGKWLVSDVLEAAILFDAALRSARLNVEVNLKELDDELFVREATSRLDAFQKSAAARLSAVTDTGA